MVEVTVSTGTKKRPWQGTTLGVLNIIGVVFAFLFGLMAIVLVGFLGGSSEFMPAEFSGMFTGLMGGLAVALSVFMIAMGVLLIFMARGAFKGQKWAPMASIVFAAIGILSAISAYESQMLLTLVINGFVLYLGIMCVKHPFYNRKKA